MLWLFRKKLTQSPGLPDYHVGPRLDASGAAIFVYGDHALTSVRILGAGTGINRMLRVTQHPQLYVNQRSVAQGLGGLQAGQFISQPLMQNGGGE